MKSFLKIVFATFFALILFCACVALLGLGLAAAFARANVGKTLAIEKGSFLVLDCSMNLTDSPPPSDSERALAKLLGRQTAEPLSVRELLNAISAASADDRIAGIFLHGEFTPEAYGSGFAAIKELREALAAFRAKGKTVAAYEVQPGLRDYYLASVASPIYLNPFGEIEMLGLGARPMFYADAFQKYGIGVQVTRVGKYKSFVEPYTRTDMSPESREQTQALLDDVWGQFKAGVAESRKDLTADTLQALTDTQGLISPQTAKEKGLVDRIAYLPDVMSDLASKTGVGSGGVFKQVDMAAYAEENYEGGKKRQSAFSKVIDSSPKLAIVYAEGEIVEGEGDSDGMIGGDRFARRLRKMRRDNQVKAVVLRVNSPGGSALASELIQHELALLREAGKPVIVSMGSVAASGGYWISTASDRVFAEPNTITGSIGVFGLLPNVQKLANDHGITFDEIKTGQLANLISVSRPKTDQEVAVVQTFVDQIYEQFIARVSTARKLPADQVKEIAQGRVWSGAAAQQRGLVDEIGGLDKAIAFAKQKGKLAPDAAVVEYPEPQDLGEKIAEMFNDSKKPISEILFAQNATAKEQLGQFEEALGALRNLNDPRGVYARLPFDLSMK